MLFANTDYGNKLKQQLDEHLVWVADQVKKNFKKLPLFEAVFNKNVRVVRNKKLNAKSPKEYKWQDNAVESIKKWKQETEDLDKNQYGFFSVNIASTGKGKTFANAKVMQSLSANEESLRYILALGLRTLTLQTGDEYKNKIGLTNKELSTLIGSKFRQIWQKVTSMLIKQVGKFLQICAIKSHLLAVLGLMNLQLRFI